MLGALRQRCCALGLGPLVGPRIPAPAVWRRFSSEPPPEPRYRVRRELVELKFCRSSGPGGQNVNKVSTKAEVRLNLAQAEWLPPAVRDRLRAREAGRVNKQDELVVTSEKTRTQHSNIDDALQKLQQLIDEATPEPKVREMWDGIGEVTKARRVQHKKHRSTIKAGRSLKSVDW